MRETLEFVRVSWPIFTAIIGALVWAIYRVEGKVAKSECDKLRAECKACQRSDQTRLEMQFNEFRHEITARFDTLTALIIERSGK